MIRLFKHRLYDVLYTSPDFVEVFIGIIKIVWGTSIILDTVSPTIHPFYFDTNEPLSNVIGALLILVGFAKIIAWINEWRNWRKIMACMVMCGWIFLMVNTALSDMPPTSLIQFSVLVISDFWLYLRLGALMNGRHHTD